MRLQDYLAERLLGLCNIISGGYVGISNKGSGCRLERCEGENMGGPSGTSRGPQRSSQGIVEEVRSRGGSLEGVEGTRDGSDGARAQH